MFQILKSKSNLDDIVGIAISSRPISKQRTVFERLRSSASLQMPYLVVEHWNYDIFRIHEKAHKYCVLLSEVSVSCGKQSTSFCN